MGIDHSNPYIHSTTVLCDIGGDNLLNRCNKLSSYSVLEYAHLHTYSYTVYVNEEIGVLGKSNSLLLFNLRVCTPTHLKVGVGSPVGLSVSLLSITHKTVLHEHCYYESNSLFF